MRLYLTERSTGKELFGIFTPIATANGQDLQLMMYSSNNNCYIGNNAEIKTDDYFQVYITKLQHIMYGTLEFQKKIYDVQVGCFLNEFNYKFEQVLIFSESPDSDLSLNYRNGCVGSLTEFDVKIIDYKGYCETVTQIGNHPVKFKQYVLRNIFQRIYHDSDLDFYPHNETSFFNEKRTEKEEDFITSKGMKIYLDEVIKNSLQSK